jgi:hypothetical protein
MRRDLTGLRPGDTLTTELQLLTSRRAGLVADRTRAINRLRGLLGGIFPALERALDLTRTGPLVLVGGYQTPAALRAISTADLATWLGDGKVGAADQLAAAAVAAAHQQSVALPGETLAAQLVATLAGEVVALNRQVHDLDKRIEGRFHRHKLAPVIASLPGIGTLGAQSSSPPPAAAWPTSAPQTGWPPSPGWLPHPGTLGASAATGTAPAATTAVCSASSPIPLWSASAAVWSPAASMIASGPRANATPGRVGPGQTPRQRLVGAGARPAALPASTTSRRRRLTAHHITPTA